MSDAELAALVALLDAEMTGYKHDLRHAEANGMPPNFAFGSNAMEPLQRELIRRGIISVKLQSNGESQEIPFK